MATPRLLLCIGVLSLGACNSTPAPTAPLIPPPDRGPYRPAPAEPAVGDIPPARPPARPTTPASDPATADSAEEPAGPERINRPERIGGEQAPGPQKTGPHKPGPQRVGPQKVERDAVRAPASASGRLAECKLLVATIDGEKKGVVVDKNVDVDALDHGADEIADLSLSDTALARLRDDYAQLVRDLSEAIHAAREQRARKREVAASLADFSARERRIVADINDHCQP